MKISNFLKHAQHSLHKAAACANRYCDPCSPQPPKQKPKPPGALSVVRATCACIFLACLIIVLISFGFISPLPVPGTSCLGPAFSSNCAGDGPKDTYDSFLPGLFSWGDTAPSNNEEAMKFTINPIHDGRTEDCIPKKKRSTATSLPTSSKPPKWNDELVTEKALRNSLFEVSCSCKTHKENCIIEAFRGEDNEVDYFEAVSFIRAMRKKIDVKQDIDLKQVVTQLMEVVTLPGRKLTKGPNDYSLFYKGVDRKLCMETFAWVFMTSQNQLKMMSANLRKGDEQSTNDGKHRYDNDSFFEDIDFKTAAFIFEDWAGISSGITILKSYSSSLPPTNRYL